MRDTGYAIVTASALMITISGCAVANDLLRAAIPQRGLWDTAVTELGKRAGIFNRHGLDVDILFTQGGPEAYQAVIAGSMNVCAAEVSRAQSGPSPRARLCALSAARWSARQSSTALRHGTTRRVALTSQNWA